MTALDVVYAVLEFLGGIGVFLFGMKLMGDTLENFAGNKIKDMFAKLSDNRFIGVGIGTATTALVQSSSAVSVMVLGFVNSNLMSLKQATAIIFGANIGTTITAQIVALGYGGITNFKFMAIFAAFAGIGAFINMFAKHDKAKKIGCIIVGLGMIFVGLSVMEASMSILKESASIAAFIATIKNPMLLLAFGIIFTAIVQSSSAVSGIVIAMTAVGVLSFPQGMYIVVGSNIGTCATALLACIGASPNAKRVALVHLLFNTTGVVLFMLTSLFVPYAKIFAVFGSAQTQIAMLHTFFNLSTVIILLPFTSVLVKIVSKVIKDKKPVPEPDAPRLYYLADRLLVTPPLAIIQLKKEIVNMSVLAVANFNSGINAILSTDIKNQPEMERNEKIINYVNREVSNFLVKLSNEEISEMDRAFIGTSFHTVSDIERIGDYAENLLEYAETMYSKGLSLSNDAKAEVAAMQETINELYAEVIKAYNAGNLDYMDSVNVLEERVDGLQRDMANKHIERLTAGECNAETGAIYMSLASNAERIADHMTNIAVAIKSYFVPKTVRTAPAKTTPAVGAAEKTTVKKLKSAIKPEQTADNDNKKVK